MAGITTKAVAFHGCRKRYLQSLRDMLVARNGGVLTTAILQQVQRAACHKRLDTTLRYLDDGSLDASDEELLAIFADFRENSNRITLDTQNANEDQDK